MDYQYARRLRFRIKISMLLLLLLSLGTVTTTSVIKYNLFDQVVTREQIKVAQQIEIQDPAVRMLKEPHEEKEPLKDNGAPKVSEPMEEKSEPAPKKVIYNGRELSIGGIIRTYHITFDTDKAIIKPGSFQELQRIVEFLKENQSVKIEISGHTDRTRNKLYSLRLSRARAESVYNYLTAQGIRPERMVVKGYGYKFPVPNSSGSLNRRVEFKILTL